jgi:3-phenylpropionate/trans-cinnamate dioxygenase ferredoxin subunit
MEDNTYIKIADSVDEIAFGENNLAEVHVDGKTICLAKVKDVLMGCAQKCPHASGIMANGFIDALGNIVCPLHRYKFNMETGRNTSGEGYYLKTYQIIVNERGVFLQKEKKKQFLSFLN